MGSKFLKGAMILSISMFATRLLGILYVVPFQRLVGETGLALYQYAYIPYSLFINLSTLGIPVGIAKFVSKYNADGEYDTSRKIFMYGTIFMFFLGILGFWALYALAPWYATRVLGGEEALYNTHEDVVSAIRMVSFAILIVPPMSIFRGFFQGNQNMTPTAVSQFVEQLVRVVLIVVGSFVILRVFNGTSQVAVSFSVFAAFLSGISSFFILYVYWIKNRKKYDKLVLKSVKHKHRSVSALFFELMSYALPFAVLALITNLFQLVDTMTFNYYMIQGAGVDRVLSERLSGIYGTSLFKIVMIPVSFSVAFGHPLVPEITAKLREGNTREVRKVLMLAIRLTSFITLPAVIGMSLLSNPIYIMFFSSPVEGLNAMGGAIFATGAFIGLFMSINSILTSVLQGIDGEVKGIVFLVIALVIKYVGNVLLIPILEVNGAILATILAHGFCVVMNLFEIKKRTNLKIGLLIKQHLSIVIFTGFMAVAVWLTSLILNVFISYEASRFQSVIYVLISGLVGFGVYFGLALYFDLMKSLFGERLSYDNVSKLWRK